MADCLAIAMFVMAWVPVGQDSTSTISGVVRVASGPIPGVAIALSAPDERKATTDAAGRYVFPNISPGLYTLSATLAGFALAEERIAIQPNGPDITWSPMLLLIQPAPPSLILMTSVVPFAGPSPQSCGVLGPQSSLDELSRAIDCVRSSALRRTGAWASKFYPGVDSVMARGLIASPSGDTYIFTFDSAPCGGVTCDAVFAIRKCDQPKLASESVSQASFGCPGIFSAPAIK
jgi:hypothetical protein